jgi:shikimate kinase
MIVHLNGWAGAGKLTVGRQLAPVLGARLADNHTLHNVAAALCDRQSPEYWSLYHRVRDLAYARMREMPADGAFVMTNSLTRDSPHELEAWQAVRELAADRGDRLIAVTLDCSVEENLQRVQMLDRRNNRKLVDPELLATWRSAGYTLETGEGADHRFVLDNTNRSPAEAAQRIAQFLESLDLQWR